MAARGRVSKSVEWPRELGVRSGRGDGGIVARPADCGRVAQWITRLTTDQKIPGSNPGVLARDSVSAFYTHSTAWQFLASPVV